MTRIPEVMDAITAALKSSSHIVELFGGNVAGKVFDGPETTLAGSEGIAVGASREDLAVEFTNPSGGLASTGEQGTVTCMCWSGSGSTVFKPQRDRVDQMLDAVEATLEQDRTLGGAVSTAWITGGSYAQEQLNGSLVIAEFRITYDRF